MGTNKRFIGTSTQQSAFGTDLGSVFRINPNNFNSFPFSFILNKTLQLEETPVANPIIHSLSSSLLSNAFEVFHNNLVSIKIGNDCLAYVMIYPLHETIFSSRKLLKKSLAGTSAFALKFGTQIFKFSLDLFDFTAIEEFIIRSDCEVIYSEINTKNSILQIRASDIDFFGKTEKKETSSFSINSQETFCNIPIIEIFRITFGNIDIELLPSFESRDAQDVVLERGTSWKIISHTAIINSGFGFSSFNHSTGLFDTGNSQLGSQSFFPDIFIDKRMKLDIITDSSLPGLIDAELEAFTINFDCPDYFIGCNNLDFSSGSDLHNNINTNNYINLSEGIFPPKYEYLGIQNARVI